MKTSFIFSGIMFFFSCIALYINLNIWFYISALLYGMTFLASAHELDRKNKKK